MNNSILYVYPETKTYNGGTICRNNNLNALRECTDNIVEYGINVDCSKIKKVVSLITGYKGSATPFDIIAIKKIIKEKNINIIFFDGSVYGKIASYLRKINKKLIIFTFFHNCEALLYSQFLQKYNTVIKTILLKNIKNSELFALKSSTKTIFLTERDYKQCASLYGTNSETLITPIVIKNTYTFKSEIKSREPRKLLFVGSYFFPNIHGLIWFINIVLPKIDFSLKIVGKGFNSEEFTSQIKESTKVEILGFVEDLDNVYEQSDIVIQPIFEGSGMKTKTAECFMYGKPLVSTTEGLIGYIDGLKYVYRCDSAEEFVETLNSLRQSELPSFCHNLRKVYEENYSLEARTENYRKLLKEMENE